MSINPLETKKHEFSSVAHLSGNIGYDINTLRYRPYYELKPSSLLVKDPVWGDEFIGDEKYDQIIVDLAHSDPLRRMQTIEQLTLTERYATIPDSYNFSRWEHMLGSLVFTRQMARKMNLDPKESMYYQLKMLLSDFRHGAFSHAADWLFQGEGGAESAHEIREDYADVVGIIRLIRLYDFDPARVFDDSTEDITDVPSPGLDGDKSDYTMRESYRWLDQSPLLKQYLNKNSFTIVDGKVVLKDIMAAKMMASCYAMLVRHNWQHPVHRLQINLLLESLKRVFVAADGRHDIWGSYSPRDLMTTSDHTFMERFKEHDEFMHHVDGIMVSLSKSERELHWQHRQNVIRYAIERATGLHPEKVKWMTDYYKELPSSCEIVASDSDKPQPRNSNRMVVLPLPALRARMIDPPFVDDNGDVTTLSKADPKLWEYIQNKLSDTRKNYKAGLVHNVQTTSHIRACLQNNKEQWPAVMRRPRLPSSMVRILLSQTVDNSAKQVSQFMEMSVQK